ncbi:hypothetical protein AC731_011205 [Thauera humireducens]|uniref:Uncharacterized protein n=1 Tax=Thauera humireducens TaxID=1134435 RepID=A0A127K669_9RHOO|nr:hypothetical protein AC731_011205 [Thauera humireducens]
MVSATKQVLPFANRLAMTSAGRGKLATTGSPGLTIRTVLFADVRLPGVEVSGMGCATKWYLMKVMWPRLAAESALAAR